MIKNRNIVVAILLTIVTCGIYGIYWFICLTNEANSLTLDDDYQTSGGMALLFTIITCGIYSFYWMYKMGIKAERISNKNSNTYPILFLVLSLFGFGIISYILLQDIINKSSDM